MAISAAAVWDVWSTGSNFNGGGFITGATGTDYSQQASAQIVYTDLVIGGAGNLNQLTSAGNPFTSSHVGNIINIISGTGFTTGRFEVVSVAGSIATMDRNVGTASSTGGTGRLGGALSTVATGLQRCIRGGMICYVKATATYQITSTIAPSTLGDSIVDSPVRIVGYTTTRGDGGHVTIQLNADSINLCTWNANADNCGYTWENFIFDGNSRATVNGFNLLGTNGKVTFYNCVFKRFTDLYCIQVGSGQAAALNCDFTDNAFTSDGSGGCMLSNSANSVSIMTRCYAANNSNSTSPYGAMRVVQGFMLCTDNIIYNNTGAGPVFQGPYCNSVQGSYVAGNIVHSNKGNGIDVLLANAIIENNICTNNTGSGIELYNGSLWSTVRNNAYFNNGAGNVVGGTDVNGITMTGLPYVNAPTDLSLNATSGAGLSCRAAGIPGTIGVVSTVGAGYRDVGPLQHQDSGPATTSSTFVG